MKKLILIASLLLVACSSLTYSERIELEQLKAHGITTNTPLGLWKKPAKPATAGALNLILGFGNFYLASKDDGETNNNVYGVLNLFTWPISIFWGVPQAYIDAKTINKKQMLYFYKYNMREYVFIYMYMCI